MHATALFFIDSFIQQIFNECRSVSCPVEPEGLWLLSAPQTCDYRDEVTRFTHRRKVKLHQLQRPEKILLIIRTTVLTQTSFAQVSTLFTAPMLFFSYNHQAKRKKQKFLSVCNTSLCRRQGWGLGLARMDSRLRA